MIELKLVGSEMHGVRVLGTVKDVPKICIDENIDLIIIAIPSATNKQMQSILNTCEKVQCELRTLPSLHDMVSGRA